MSQNVVLKKSPRDKLVNLCLMTKTFGTKFIVTEFTLGQILYVTKCRCNKNVIVKKRLRDKMVNTCSMTKNVVPNLLRQNLL